MPSSPPRAGSDHFSHIGDSSHGGGTTTLEQSAAAHGTQVLVQGAEAVDDQIGFANPATTTTTSKQGSRRSIRGADEARASTEQR
jgi:hypothetical protein